MGKKKNVLLTPYFIAGIFIQIWQFLYGMRFWELWARTSVGQLQKILCILKKKTTHFFFGQYHWYPSPKLISICAMSNFKLPPYTNSWIITLNNINFQGNNLWKWFIKHIPLTFFKNFILMFLYVHFCHMQK